MTDALILGDGIIGLASALAIARSGGSCRIVGRNVPGSASVASAGLLAPSIGAAEPDIREFMIASRDRYPSWMHWLAERTGIEVTLNRLGIIELDGGQADRAPTPTADRLDSTTLHALEPALAPGRATLHRDDGFVDNVRLLAALREAVRCEWSIEVVDGRAAKIEAGAGGCSVMTEDGRTQHGECVVVAAGAWSALIVGAPRSVPVEPVRGQMLQLLGCPLSHAVSTPDAYLVPRGEFTLVGSTLERVGYDNTTTPGALAHLRASAASSVPSLASAEVESTWAGLRPMTPDGLPVIGRDPDVENVLYACGHGKNGILLAPLTAECVAALVGDVRPPMDLSRFGVERFD
ncbi:MAG TPA: FAD-dependent oxidoreductase [Gemmatimonadaceae bacterium]|jgi:glycine oxidase